MAGRQLMPIQCNRVAAIAAILLMGTWNTGPAVASVNSPKMCDDASTSSFEISGSQLETIHVNHEIDANDVEITKSNIDDDALSPTHYLSPRAEAALRKVLVETTTPVAEAPVAENPLADDIEWPAVKTRVPGVSDNDLVRYKRQMYRRDI